MSAVGFADLRIVEETNDFMVDSSVLDDPDALFCFSPLWPRLSADQKPLVLATIRTAQARAGGILAVASPALIAIGRRC